MDLSLYEIFETLIVLAIEQLVNSRRHKEQLLEGIQPDDKLEYYENPEELLETLLLCYDSMVSITPLSISWQCKTCRQGKKACAAWM